MMQRRPLRGHATVAALIALLAATADDALAQGAQQNVTGRTQQQAGDQPANGQNEYGWPTNFVTQVGAGTTNSVTTGYSGIDDPPPESPEPSLPELPSAELCEPWEGSDAHPFCMDKLVE